MARPGSSLIRRLSLPLSSAVLLTLAFAPVSQYYLAWIGLAPWLLFLAEAPSQRSAFKFSWVGGTAFFVMNMWWMAHINVPGMVALLIYCGLYWGLAGLVIRGAALVDRGIGGVFGVAAVWTAFEWIRGHLFTGLPWLYLGYTQTPVLNMCQVADVGGVYAVTFWLAAANALAALLWLHRDDDAPLKRPIISVAVLLALCGGYGWYRMRQTPAMLSEGPLLAVIQSNYPQSNSGAKGASLSDRLSFHVGETLAALAKNPGQIDLVAWSETMMAPLNAQARAEDEDLQRLHQLLSQLASKNHVALLTGAEYAGDWKSQEREGQLVLMPMDCRNSAYLFDRDGRMDDSPGHRYDKIHLVPFGEFIPFKRTLPFLYRLFVALGPRYYSDYELQAGPRDAMTVFELKGGDRVWRFVTPICFEDIDANLCAAMFRPAPGGPGGKRADFLVNLTNDGWFMANENRQHAQAAIFRCIENRVPAARSVNTGVSGLIDSTGQPLRLLAPRTPGWTVGKLMLDSRVTFYTRWGDGFALGCVAAAAGIALMGWMRRQTTAERPS